MREEKRSPTSLKALLEVMAETIDDTPGAEGVFISIDMAANELRALDGTYYLGKEADRFGSEAKDGFVPARLLVEYYGLLATDISRFIGIEHPFADGDAEAWESGRNAASLEEVNLEPDARFVSVPVQELGTLASLNRELLQQAPASTFEGKKFLHDAETGVETRVTRVTLEGLIRSASPKKAGEAYPAGSWGQSLTYQPVHTGMGTSGFRGKVGNMRDAEPFVITLGFQRWLV